MGFAQGRGHRFGVFLPLGIQPLTISTHGLRRKAPPACINLDPVVDDTVDHQDRGQHQIGAHHQRNGHLPLQHQIEGQLQPAKHDIGRNGRGPGQ